MRLQAMILPLMILAFSPLHAETSKPSDASFGFKLLKQVSTEHPGENVIIAPRNIRTALAAVATGAEGETQQQILALTGEFKSIDNTSLSSAQSAMDIWVAPVEKLLPSFAAGLPGIQVQSTDTADAPTAINDFISQQTHGMIQHVVNKVGNSRIVLTTVLYFNGRWEQPFKKEYTRSKPFHLINGKTVDTDMMSQYGEFAYAESNIGQIIQLRYEGNDNLVLTVFLPKPKINISSWLASLDEASWYALLGHLSGQSGSLQLPKLTSSFSATLNDDLQALGMHRPFTDDAQFHGIVQNHPLKISQVVHRTVFDMDETSTEASAATIAGLVPAGAAPLPRNSPPPFNMVVDRPFFLTVGDKSNEHILFAGVVDNP